MHVCASVEGELRQSVEFLQLEHGALLLFPLSVRLSEVWVEHKELMSDPQRCHHRYEASRSVISSEHEITKDNSVLGYDHMILSCWSGAAAVSVCQPGRWKIEKNSQNLFSRLAGYPVSDLTFLIYSSPPCLIIAWSPCRDADFLFNTADISQMLFCVDPLQCVMYNILMRWNGYSMFPSQTHSSNEKVCHLCLEDPSSSFVWLLPVQWCCMLSS